MKKIYILGLLGLSLSLNAQNSKFPTKSSDQAFPSIKTSSIDYTAPSPVIDRPSSSRGSGFGKNALWTKVGTTFFDRQTNSSVYRRILAYPNGKISINWHTSNDGAGANFLGRGSGYNHFDGTTWGPISNLRLEPFRAGYPGLDYNGTTEIIMSHRVDTNGKSGGLIYSTNGSIGGSTWTSNIVLTEALSTSPTVLWPRTAISGDFMHVVANYTGTSASQPDSAKKAGVINPTVYSRYKFSTSTWEVQNITLPGFDSTRWYAGNADGYAIDANGSNVAILMGGVTDDVTLWKSSDNGLNWDTTIILPFQYPAFNDQVEILDTPNVCDGAVAIKLDATGKAHCFWGRLRVLNTTANDGSFNVFLGTNSIDYWYEGRPDSIIRVAGAIDGNNNGELELGSINARSRYGNSGAATMPYAVTNTNGDIFMIYSALAEDDRDAEGGNFRDIFIVFSKDNGITWSRIQNLTAVMGFNKEQMFGSAVIANDKLHLTFMESDQIGFYTNTDNPGKLGPFNIMYYNISIADIEGGKVGLLETKNNLFSVNSNYPNPFRNSTIIPINLTQKSDVMVTVMNILGEVVYTKNFDNTFAGVNNLDINGNFTSGFYFYTVEAGGYKVSGKMLAE